MEDFSFCSPTKIIFGRNSVQSLSSELIAREFKKVLLIYGSNRIETTGLKSLISDQLSAAKVAFFELKDIRPNPETSKVEEGITLCRDNKIDFILAVGGGSVIDTAKAIAAGFYYSGNPFDFNRHIAKPARALPIGVVLTYASAGSETSSSCVIQDDLLKIKAGFNSDFVRPVFAIEDPTLTYSLSPYLIAVGAADTIMHSLERLVNKSDDELSDEFAISIIKKTMEYAKISLQNPDDYDARAGLMLCSSLSHNGLTSLGKCSVFNVHPIEHGLSGYKSDIVHGAGVALIYPAWAEYVCDLDIKKFAFITKRIFQKEYETEKETAIMGSHLFRDYFSKLGLPTTLKDVGLSEKDISPIADLVTDNGTRVIGRYPKSLNREDVKNILLKLL